MRVIGVLLIVFGLLVGLYCIGKYGKQSLDPARTGPVDARLAKPYIADENALSPMESLMGTVVGLGAVLVGARLATRSRGTAKRRRRG